ncbi:single-stranded DNA-binding protein [Salmonella enterica]|nr:single-stranded DNA-binding protein [Salmonella enterica]EJA5819100.1 single-stranded DNA-binding protein [Salmonella enterica]EJA5856131.1 single-stranded DNA-binding protein [Salmonella enterica]EJF5729530.1 single-stranded DNA-binding protein [Salmonella enterica]EJX4303073.1 single-stranded DNA-binding protein [Salmonella enterica]
MTAQIAAYGRIAADIQTKTTSNGNNMAFTRMAVSLPCRTAENGEAVMWLGVTAFGKQADALAKHQKGDLVSVSGQLQINQWTGQDGGTHSGYAIVADSVISARTVRPGGSRTHQKAIEAHRHTRLSPPAGKRHRSPPANRSRRNSSQYRNG